jgi:hypothetical protein
MGFTSAGLANGGKTAHYQISYDTAFAGNTGLNLAAGLLAACEQDFNLMSGWFAGVGFEFSFPLPVQIVNAGGGASWSDPPNISLPFGYSPTVTVNALDPPTAPSALFLRYLLVSEVTEMFMASQGKGWSENASLFQGADEGSTGEGLSRFLGVQLNISAGSPPVPFPGFGVVPLWLNSPRPNFVDNNPDDNQPDVTTGCTTCFVYFLHNQLGFSIPAIVAAAAGSLAGVYQNLTGKNDAWTAFSTLVNSHYPTGFLYSPKGDNIFPVSALKQFFAPNQITCGYNESTQVFIDTPALAEVHIQLTSDTPAVASVPSSVTIPVGGQSATVTVSAPAIAGPFAPKMVNIHASYAGKTLTMAAEVVPPRVISVTLSPASVTCGDSSIATVTLDRASLAGPVVANIICGAPGFATVPATVTILQGHISATFTITTPAIQVPFKTAQASIYVTYADSNASAVLTVKSKVVAGILNTLTLFPATVTGGNTSHGTVTLVQAVPTPTVIGLAAIEAAAAGVPGGNLPLPSNNSSLATVPSQITIPAGQTTGSFNITTNHNLSPGTKRKATIMASAVTFKYASLTIEY